MQKQVSCFSCCDDSYCNRNPQWVVFAISNHSTVPFIPSVEVAFLNKEFPQGECSAVKLALCLFYHFRNPLTLHRGHLQSPPPRPPTICGLVRAAALTGPLALGTSAPPALLNYLRDGVGPPASRAAVPHCVRGSADIQSWQVSPASPVSISLFRSH